MNDLRLELRFKNAILYGKLELLTRPAAKVGPRKRSIIGAASKLLGVDRSSISGYLNLKQSPRGRNGLWRPNAITLAHALDMEPEDLFPDELYRGAFAESMVETVESNRMLPLSAAREIASGDFELIQKSITDGDRMKALDGALKEISPRQEKVIRMRYGLEPYEREYTLAEIGYAIGVSTERTRQIESKAMRILRWSLPSFPQFKGLDGKTI